MSSACQWWLSLYGNKLEWCLTHMLKIENDSTLSYLMYSDSMTRLTMFECFDALTPLVLTARPGSQMSSMGNLARGPAAPPMSPPPPPQASAAAWQVYSGRSEMTQFLQW